MTDMTREEAIETLLYRVKCPKGQHDVVRIVWDNDIVCQAIDAAVEALENSGQNCGNCVHHNNYTYWCDERVIGTDNDMHCTDWSDEE